MDYNEDILKEALWNELQTSFGFHNEWDVVPYFLIRERIAVLEDRRKSLSITDFYTLGLFMLNECKIKICEDDTIRVGEYAFSSKAFHGSAFRNILEDWWFQCEMKLNYTMNEWDEKYKNIMELAKKATPVKSKHPMYKTYVRSYAYGFLNEAFRLQPTGECGTKFVLTDTALVTPTREEELMRYIQAYYHLLHKSEEVSEVELEEYMMRHLDVIEKGLRMVSRQVQLPEGRIDLLARDAQERDVIIELKVDKDTDLIWQRMYYESEWSKKNKPPRMVIVTTKRLDASVKEALRKVGETLVLEVIPFVQKKKLKEIRVSNRYTLSPAKEAQGVGLE